jgi:glucose-6-phosphate 1-epimerase
MPSPIESLVRELNCPGLSLHTSPAGLKSLRVDSSRCAAEVFIQGAHVSHWQPAGHEPVLFMSSIPPEPGRAIRGGVPICFPWFNNQRADFDKGSAPNPPKHGFARITDWTLASARPIDGDVELAFTLTSDATTRSHWPADFVARITARFGATLRMSMSVTNTGPAPCRFEQALHTYFSIGNVEQISLLKPAWATSVRYDQPLDRVVDGTTETVVLHDKVRARKIRNRKFNSHSTVIWFPFMPEPGKSTLPDMTQPDSRRMFCIETANAGANIITLAPGCTHEMGFEVDVVRD